MTNIALKLSNEVQRQFCTYCWAKNYIFWVTNFECQIFLDNVVLQAGNTAKSWATATTIAFVKPCLFSLMCSYAAFDTDGGPVVRDPQKSCRTTRHSNPLVRWTTEIFSSKQNRNMTKKSKQSTPLAADNTRNTVPLSPLFTEQNKCL